jgi:hypothetical protein
MSIIKTNTLYSWHGGVNEYLDYKNANSRNERKKNKRLVSSTKTTNLNQTCGIHIEFWICGIFLLGQAAGEWKVLQKKIIFSFLRIYSIFINFSYIFFLSNLLRPATKTPSKLSSSYISSININLFYWIKFMGKVYLHTLTNSDPKNGNNPTLLYC